MTFSRFSLSIAPVQQLFTWKRLAGLMLSLLLILGAACWWEPPAAIAGLNDDRYDGDIFALYASNGSLVPPKYTLKQALAERQKPILLVFYVDDSSDCKAYSTVVSQLQAFYGRAADFLAVRVDSLNFKERPGKTDEEFYYTGVVPQTVLFDAQGQPVLNEAGIISFERVDDVFREVFDLLPRSQSKELKRRPLNEINTELTQS
ncbi:MAG: thylakoid membrane photosystem I accumulation factor [Leptolyngbyaceae cyanobacterium bins.349]|nr:thylakoid membrane photosystem I accumulation factor [Leptolyngbyaceae cyanobacterium bins.349]